MSRFFGGTPLDTTCPSAALRPGRTHGLLRLTTCLLLVLSACTSGADEDSSTTASSAGVSSSTSTPAAQPLLVVDVEALPVEEQLTFAALQGIVNRDTPTLYLVGLRSAQDFDVDPSAQAWLADVVDLPVEEIDPDEALARLLPRSAGLVVWDPAVPYESQNVATTIAGVEDLVPVDPPTAERFTAEFDQRVVRDLRDLHLVEPDEWYSWATDNLDPAQAYPFPVWTGRPRNGKPVQPGLRDWAVMNRAFVFDADPAAERGLLDRTLAMFPAGTPIYGYPFFDTDLYLETGLAINEAIAAASVAAAGHWLVPTTDAANLSVHVHLGPATAKPVWDDTPRTPDDATTYVSFTISDGDAMGYVQTLLRHLHLDGIEPGSIPIGVSISPYLAEDAPKIWDWLITEAPEQVRYVAGPSGAGYAYPYAMSDLGGYLDHSRELLDRHGLRSTWILNPPLTGSSSVEELEQFVARTQPSLLLTDYGSAPPEPPTVAFVDGVPVVHTVMISSDSVDIAEVIRSVASTQPAGPKFVAIALNTWGTGIDDAERAMTALGPGFEAVAPDAFAGLLRGANAAGYDGSLERWTPPPAPDPGMCRATVADLDGSGDPFASRFLGRLLAQASLDAGLRLESPAPGTIIARFDTDTLAKNATDFAGSNLHLGYGESAVDSAEVTLSLREITIPGVDVTAGEALALRADEPRGEVGIELTGATAVVPGPDVALRAELAVTATWNPGDTPHSVTVSGPVTCTPIRP